MMQVFGCPTFCICSRDPACTSASPFIKAFSSEPPGTNAWPARLGLRHVPTSIYPADPASPSLIPGSRGTAVSSAGYRFSSAELTHSRQGKLPLPACLHLSGGRGLAAHSHKAAQCGLPASCHQGGRTPRPQRLCIFWNLMIPLTLCCLAIAISVSRCLNHLFVLPAV